MISNSYDDFNHGEELIHGLWHSEDAAGLGEEDPEARKKHCHQDKLVVLSDHCEGPPGEGGAQ